uniref:Retrotransposon gag domain-containing protein n=1 Tax=Cajanus cajan TaxID=3821 RepID=A0A151SX90_CAJCA|nr:hypothetical protein KK1_014862 [Cajanus cajan]
MEGHNFDIQEAADMCLVQDIQFSAKFKIPDFQKYTRASCPKGHLTMYCRKMAAYVSNEKLLIHYFQESLSNLADAFLRRYKYNIDLILDRSDLQSLSKKGDEYFKTYAQRWREMAARTPFTDIVTIGERVEQGLKSGKIGKSPESQGYKKIFGGNEINFLTSSTTPRTTKASRKEKRELDKTPISYIELFPQLMKASMLVRTPPQRKQQSPYPLWYRLEETCDYHAGAVGHSIENCKALKSRVQELVDAGKLKFEANTTHIKE